MALQLEGISPENAKALLDGSKTPEQVVKEEMGIIEERGRVNTKAMTVEENPDGTGRRSISPEAGPASTSSLVNIGMMSHEDAIRMAHNQATENMSKTYSFRRGEGNYAKGVACTRPKGSDSRTESSGRESTGSATAKVFSRGSGPARRRSSQSTSSRATAIEVDCRSCSAASKKGHIISIVPVLKNPLMRRHVEYAPGQRAGFGGLRSPIGQWKRFFIGTAEVMEKVPGLEGLGQKIRDYVDDKALFYAQENNWARLFEKTINAKEKGIAQEEFHRFFLQANDPSVNVQSRQYRPTGRRRKRAGNLSTKPVII